MFGHRKPHPTKQVRRRIDDAYEVARLNAPDPLSSPGGSHVSLLRYVQFPVQSAKFPASILREFRGNTFNLFANARAGSPSPASSGKISLYFPAKQGIRDGAGFADDCLHRSDPLLHKGLRATSDSVLHFALHLRSR